MASRKFSRTRRTAIAGGAALVIGGAATGGVVAQQQGIAFAPAAAAPDEDVLIIAEAGTVDPIAHHDDWLKSLASKLGVTIDRLKQAIEEANKERGFPGPLFGIAPRAGAFTIRIDPGFAAAAKALGITEQQLKDEHRTKSLTDIARARNVDPKVVREAIKAQRIADLDKAVAEGKLSAEMATRLKSHLDMELDHLLSMRLPAPGKPVLHFERAITVHGAP